MRLHVVSVSLGMFLVAGLVEQEMAESAPLFGEPAGN